MTCSNQIHLAFVDAHLEPLQDPRLGNIQEPRYDIGLIYMMET